MTHLFRSTAVAASLGLAMLLAGCGNDPKDQCGPSAKAECERMYTCDAAVKFGDNQTDCAERLETLCKGFIDQRNGEPCEAGKTYDGSAAKDCASATSSQTCEDYNAGNSPAACDNVCK